MDHPYHACFGPVVGLFLGLLLLAGLAPASAQYQMNGEVLGAGGGAASGGSYQISGTIGQAVGMEASSSGFSLREGFWQITLQPAATAIDPAAEEIPTDYELGPNYPNPFNPQTRIRYGLPEAAEVYLAAYDMLGREVRVLVDGERPAGRHQATFKATGLPSGTYLYRMEAGSFTATGIMSLVK